MDSRRRYPLVASPAQQGSPAPVIPGATANDSTDSTNLAPDALFGPLWCCWLLTLAFFRDLRLLVIHLRSQANYWQAQHQRAVRREANLKEERQLLQAHIRDLQRRLYGRKSETSSSADRTSQAAVPPDRPRRHRGHQAGTPSHGRRHHDHLPTEPEYCTLPEEQRCCPSCHEPLEEIPGTADGDILEVEVRAYRRRYHRQRYRRH